MVFVGIDASKHRLHVCVRPSTEEWSVENDAKVTESERISGEAGTG
jgi:hypothetical protein